MCTPTIALSILDALQARTANLSVFTAFDVTTDVRDGTDDIIRHNEVRNICSCEFLNGDLPDGYDRESIPLNIPNKSSAFVYFPDSKSAYDHPLAVDRPSANAPIPTTTPTSVSSSAPTTKQGGSTKDGTDYLCTETSKGVINIPKDVVEAVSPVNGKYNLFVSGSIFLKAPDGKGRLRICSSKLGGGNQFRISVNCNTITIVSE